MSDVLLLVMSLTVLIAALYVDAAARKAEARREARRVELIDRWRI